MLTQRKEVNFEGQNIYVGLDVHLKSWSVSVLTQEHHHKTFSQPPDVRVLIAYLERNFPGASYYSAYEVIIGQSVIIAGFRLQNGREAISGK